MHTSGKMSSDYDDILGDKFTRQDALNLGRFSKEDYDAIEVCGYDYIHWLVANIDLNYLDEGASITNKDYITQGVNSNNTNSYIGMAPPDKMHTYDITLYALDTRLNLSNGFSYSELHNKMIGHILSQVNIKASYDN